MWEVGSLVFPSCGCEVHFLECWERWDRDHNDPWIDHRSWEQSCGEKLLGRAGPGEIRTCLSPRGITEQTF